MKIWNNQYPAIITKMSVEYLEKEPPKALVDPKPPRFVNKENQHFLMKSKTDIVKIRSVKRLIESLGEYKSELTRFAKDEKVEFAAMHRSGHLYVEAHNVHTFPETFVGTHPMA